jgi:hypothetical protein
MRTMSTAIQFTGRPKLDVYDHKVSFSRDRSRFVLQGWWQALDQIEQPLATRFNMCAVLDIVGDQNFSAAA